MIYIIFTERVQILLRIRMIYNNNISTKRPYDTRMRSGVYFNF